MDIWISNVLDIDYIIVQKNITHMIGVLGTKPIDRFRMPQMFTDANYLKIGIDNMPESISKVKVRNMLDWGQNIPPDSKILVFCVSGMRRSTACALALRVLDWGVDRIDDAAAWLVSVRPQALPDPLIIRYADDELQAGGKLIEAAEKIALARLDAAYNGDITQRLGL